MNKLDPSVAGSEQLLMTQLDANHSCNGYRALTAPGLVIGLTTASSVKITNTTTYLFAGAFKSKTTAEVPFITTTHDIAANASTVQERMYVLYLDGSGNPTIVAGAISTGAGTALLPERTYTLTPIGSVRIAVAAGATNFTANTTLLSAAALTVTYTDIGFLAPRFDSAQ